MRELAIKIILDNPNNIISRKELETRDDNDLLNCIRIAGVIDGWNQAIDKVSDIADKHCTNKDD